MRIPKQFHLGGIVVTVEMDPTLHKNKGMLGEARYAAQKIVIDPTVAAAETMEQAFWHELIHYITFMMSEDELRNNEKFVDIAAHFLHQAVKTSTGEWADYGKGGGTSLESNPKQLAPEQLVPLSAGLLEYAVWLQQRIAALEQDGGCGRQAFREIRALLDGEVVRLGRELVRLMVG